MKTSIKILVLAVALVVMNGCNAQKRAQRQVRRAVEKCPELVQVKAHLIDTFFTAPAFADVTKIPLSEVLSLDTIYAATPHGTVVVSLRQSDSALRVGFVAAPQQIHYRDTITYSQVVLPSEAPKAARFRLWPYLLVFASGLVSGAFLLRWILRLRKDYYNSKSY